MLRLPPCTGQSGVGKRIGAFRPNSLRWAILEPMRLEAKLFGTPTLQIAGQPLEVGGKTLGLLYGLLLAPLSRADATALLWGDDGAQSLRQALVVLRKLPHAKDWLHDGEMLSVQADTDVWRFEAALLAADSARAIELCTGKLLEGVQIKSGAFMEWLNTERTRLERGLASALRLEIARLEQQHAQIALGYAERLLELDPLDEAALQIALRLEVQLGLRDAAQQRLNQFRRLLKTELGSEPLPETLELLGQNNLAQRYARARRLAADQTDAAFWAEVLGVSALDLAELEPEPSNSDMPQTLRLLLEKQIALAREKRFDPNPPQAHTEAAKIAGHFLRASEPRAALPWWVQSGQLAHKAGALSNAKVAHFAALWITQDEPARRDCLIALGNLAEATSDLPLMQAVWLELQRLGTLLQDDLTLFHAKHRLASWAIRSAQATNAIQAAEEAAHIAGRIAQPELQALANGTLGTAQMASGNLAQAREALLLAGNSQDPQLHLRVYANLGSVSGMLGQLEEATSHLETALTIARSLQNLPVVAMVLFNLGATAEKLSKLGNAETHFREAIEISSRLGNASMVLQATLGLAQIHAARGHWGEAFNTAIEAHELAQNTPLLPQVHMFLGELETRFGRLEAAQSWLSQAEAGFATASNQRLHLSAQANLALLGFKAGQHTEAEVQSSLEALRDAGHQDQFDHIRLEFALLASTPKHIAWALAGLDESRLSVQVARARLASINRQKPTPDLGAALESALEQEVYLDVPLGFALLGQENRAQEVKVLSAAGLPKAQRTAFMG
jgi:DNA-binding SARP family transcriptional activator/tetratricopeptide (TPR) repeat protein